MAHSPTSFHASVRHYQSPFPLGHRNARAFPSPSSHQGPWGAVERGEKAATSPLSTSYDKRNSSRIPLATGYGEGRSLHKATDKDRSTDASPGRHSEVSLLRNGAPRSPFVDPYHDLIYGDSSYMHAVNSLDAQEACHRDEESVYQRYREDDKRRRHMSTHQSSSSPAQSHSGVWSPIHNNADGATPRQARAADASRASGEEPRASLNAASTHDAADEVDGYDFSNLQGGSVRMDVGKREGLYSDRAERRLEAAVVPADYHAPNTIRLAMSRSIPEDQESTGSAAQPSPRRRAPARVPVGFIYKTANVPGHNAPVHVQIPMGYRAVSDRPQLPAKVNQYSPWKSMRDQAPLPTLEPTRGGSPRRLQAKNLIGPDDASARYAPVEQRLVQQLLWNPEQKRGTSQSKGSSDIVPVSTLYDYVKSASSPPKSSWQSDVSGTVPQTSQPSYAAPPNHSSMGGPPASPLTHPHVFETSRKSFQQKSNSNVPLSPNGSPRNDRSNNSTQQQHHPPRVGVTGGGENRLAADRDEADGEVFGATYTSEYPHEDAIAYASSRQDQQHYASLQSSDRTDYEASIRSPQFGERYGNSERASPDDTTNYALPRQQRIATTNGSSADGDLVTRGKARSSPYGPQMAFIPDGWRSTAYGLPQPAPTTASPRRRAPARVPVGFIYKTANVPGHNAPVHVQIPMGYRAVSDRPQLPAKVNQFTPTKSLAEQAQLLTLDPSPAQIKGKVERLPATPLIVEVNERLAAQGLGTILDIRHAPDEKISAVLQSLGFCPADRMTILWELRRKHPHP